MRLVINRGGIGEILKGPGVQADLAARAARVAATAGEGMEASSQVGATRARTSVITATTQARLNEATDKTLTKAFGAAR